ncbi:DNA polymerase epsilon subunit 3-like [Ctenocephalides felis]|uniref:DNA polymerase epsilon subunit 3-like n=1 Tax=Ctenocephalides felis TaxID=7515 RepID=UPI000E6E46DF|nr:DNA polymerase epsilon subunit 3-like [Ctenocephalides felis]XP_026479031.1 DNA polymerase epsilon subunit 3-like [Ctenocephalides felis]
MAEKLEDLNLPNAAILRLIKEALPEGVNVGKDARTALGKAASVFVLYLTAAATNISKKKNKKTLGGSDVLEALVSIEFDNFVEPLKESLEAFRNQQKEKKETQAKRKSETPKDSEDKDEAEAEAVASDDDEEMAEAQ